MMQNSPLFVAQPSPTKHATQSPPAKQTHEKSEETGSSFKQVLSKQVAHEEPKATKEEPKMAKEASMKEASMKERAVKEAAVKDVATQEASDRAKATLDANGKVDDAQVNLKNETEILVDVADIDPQLLASTVTAKTVEDVTDGEVVLDVPQETDDIKVPLANITATIQTSTTGKKANAGAELLVEQSSGRTKKASAEVDVEPKVADDLDIINEKASNPIVENEKVMNTKLANYLAGEKRLQSQEAPTSQTVSSVTNVSSLSAMSMQAAAQAFSQPVPTAQPVGFSNMINVAPGKSGWSEAIGQKVVWMVGAAEQSATLTLNPKDLGPLQVIINVNNEKADATFISENPEVRKALEEGMSNLRQSMGQAGVELGQANVNTNKEQQAFQQEHKAASNNQAHADNGMQDADVVSSSPVHSRATNGLVDTFV